jgi:hypothetical protein
MAKTKRDVEFQHRGSGSRPRRSSQAISERSSTASDKGSPNRNGAPIKDVCDHLQFFVLLSDVVVARTRAFRV